MDRLRDNGVRIVELTGGECTIHLGAPGKDDHFGFGVPNAACAVEPAAGIAGEPSPG